VASRYSAAGTCASPAERDLSTPAPRITELLEQARTGDANARDRVFESVYAELRRLAHRQLAGQGNGRTLDTTGLVHECYLCLAGAQGPIRDRGHFFALAARVMRQVIVDYARERLALKRGGGARAIPVDDVEVAEERDALHLIEVSDMLDRLGAHDMRLAQVVECRFFAGLTEPETAEALGISERSVRRDWVEARDWMAANGA